MFKIMVLYHNILYLIDVFNQFKYFQIIYYNKNFLINNNLNVYNNY